MIHKTNTIAAVTVNHNTSRYTELMVRSLLAHHSPDMPISLTVYDNASQDNTDDLQKLLESKQIPFRQSGFTTETMNNSHGEVLQRFVLENPDCTHYLFLDADVCFIEDNTLAAMMDELHAQPNAFGIAPLMSWDGKTEILQATNQENPEVYEARLHPCCALVKNTPTFRSVVETIGLSATKYLWAEREEYLDTFKLMTCVMNTHGLRHIISSHMVIHFFAVSYTWEPTEHLKEQKAQLRDELLVKYRKIV